LLRVKTKGKQIVSSIGEGKIYVIDEICTHVGDPLDVDIHDITLTLMLETEKFQMQQYGL
jgi:nitrite reductase/ring-hydroxylating ferredoxin subunit